MKKGLVSIIIPVYNAERFLEDTIKTIQDQTYENWEAIFVDDCSKDNSVKILDKYQKEDSRIKVFKLENNSGNPCFPRNFGIDKASGNYICFLDADDLWDNDKLEKQIIFMNEKNCAFSYHSYEFADCDGNPTGKKVIAKEKISYNYCLINNIISTITVMFDVTKLDKELIKMPDLIYVEDFATWLKVLRNNYVAYGIPDLFSYYRRLPNTNSSNKIRTLKHVWNLYKNVEKINIFKALYCFCMKNMNALLRRL